MMKKLIAMILVLVMALALCACAAEEEGSIRRDVKQNVGKPIEETTETTTPEETTEDTTEVVTEPTAIAQPYSSHNIFTNIHNNEVVPGEISVKVRTAYWEKDGSLYVECFIVNGLDVTLTSFTAEQFSIYNEDGLIADGSFSKPVAMLLAPNENLVHTFHFLPDAVKATNADLQSLITGCHYSYTYQ